MLKSIEDLFKLKSLPPVLLLFGEEDFLIEEALDKIIETVCPDENSRYELVTIDSEEDKPEKIIDKFVDAALAFPFLSERRVVVVKNFDKIFTERSTKKNDKYAPIERYLKSPQKTTFLILVSHDDKLKGAGKTTKSSKPDAKPSKSSKFPYDLIFSNYEFIEFPKIYESNFSSWLSDRAKKFGKTIEANAIDFLITQTNPTLRDLDNELQKLLIYCSKEDKITYFDVTFVVGASRNYNVYELQKAVGSRNLARTLSIIENILGTERAEMLIMTVITKYFAVLWKMQEFDLNAMNDYELASKIGVNPYFVKDYKSSARNYSSDDIENAFRKLCETDEKLKSTSTDSIYLLQTTFIEIMQK